MDLEYGRIVHSIKDAHPGPINKVALMSTPNDTVEGTYPVTGDDDGLIRVWDLRANDTNKPILEFHDHIDYISDFLVIPHKKFLASTSGDGFLNVYDTRKGKLKASSNGKETELLNL